MISCNSVRKLVYCRNICGIFFCAALPHDLSVLPATAMMTSFTTALGSLASLDSTGARARIAQPLSIAALAAASWPAPWPAPWGLALLSCAGVFLGPPLLRHGQRALPRLHTSGRHSLRLQLPPFLQPAFSLPVSSTTNDQRHRCRRCRAGPLSWPRAVV